MKLLLLNLAIFILVGCSNRSFVSTVDDTTIKNGKLIVEIADSNTPLTQNTSTVWYQNGENREKIFAGFGPSDIKFTFLNNDLLVIEYCMGNIQHINSSFFREFQSKDNSLKIIRIQVITNKKFQYKNIVFCNDNPKLGVR